MLEVSEELVLLSQLEQSGVGLSVNNFYAGGFLHADDIKTLATSADSVKNQAATVKNFCSTNFLKLNVEKCEIISFSYSSVTGTTPQCEVDGSSLS